MFHRIILALKSIESDHNLTLALNHVPQSLILYIPFHAMLLRAHQMRSACAGGAVLPPRVRAAGANVWGGGSVFYPG